MAEKTIFEKIVAGEIPCKKVLENERFLAFYDINPKAPVHILAIPKVCVKDFDCGRKSLPCMGMPGRTVYACNGNALLWGISGERL